MIIHYSFHFRFLALPKVAVTGQTGKEGKGKKSVGSLKTFYICMIVVAVLGVVIALAMCIFDPLKRWVYFSKSKLKEIA